MMYNIGVNIKGGEGMKKLQLINTDGIINEIREQISTVDEGKYIHRLDALLLIAHGRDAYDVAEMYGHSPRTLHDWIKGVNKYGLGYLHDSFRPGRPARLSNTELEALKEDLQKKPVDFDYSYSSWDGKLLAEHIKKKFNIELKVLRCQLLFHELGFSYKRPRKMAYGSSREKKEEFKKNQ